MIKYIVFVLVLALVASGIWFWSKTDPQKLDFADRMAPGPVEYRQAPRTSIAYGDDARQKLDVYLPKQNAVGASTVLIFFHGGSWHDGEREGYGFLGRAFAHVVLSRSLRIIARRQACAFPPLSKIRRLPLLGSMRILPNMMVMQTVSL
jgi:hypothetical protein